MELKKPKPKKNSPPHKSKLLPGTTEKEIIGVFNGQFVSVNNFSSMKRIYDGGSFGKGILSKGEPSYYNICDDIPKIMLRNQYENWQKWSSSLNTCFLSTFCRKDFEMSILSLENFFKSVFDPKEEESWKDVKENKVENPVLYSSHEKRKINSLEIQLDDNDYTDEAFCDFVNDILKSQRLKKFAQTPKYSNEVIVVDSIFDPSDSSLNLVSAYSYLKKLPSPCVENLNLGLEESFFLKSILGCLKIVDLNFSELKIPDLWAKFNIADKNFTERYLTYHYYRSKGWVVKSGLKFGGDYLLYKSGPAYFHASYLVKVLDGRKKLTWREFIAMNRLVETYNKDLLLANIVPIKTTSVNDSFIDALKSNCIQEISIKRWFPTKERCSKEEKNTK